MSSQPLVSVVMGSDSDWPVMAAAVSVLDEFGVPCEADVVSAHRMPRDMISFGSAAASRGLRVIIAGAGGAAHLPGMLAAVTPLPVIGVPVPLARLDGLDSLLSIVQMPAGIPVATVAVGGARNAGLLAIRILATSDEALQQRMIDFQDDLLAELDVVIASIHQSFNQTEAETTRRLIGAARNPYVHILGHLTGRLLLEREPYKVDHRAVIDACAETGTWIELNAHPMRFDMDWRWWPYAKSKGVKCAINCDAHRFEHAGFLRLGAGIARKGWLTKEDVVNTLSLKGLMKELGRKRAVGRKAAPE
jgi:phosphoribosylaminoimidazole carboxylase PurE protein